MQIPNCVSHTLYQVVSTTILHSDEVVDYKATAQLKIFESSHVYNLEN